MSSIGSPLETSLLQAAQAQQVTSKTRDRERAASDRGRRLQDLVELKVAGVEEAEAARRLPHSDSEEAEAEREQTREDAEGSAGGTDRTVAEADHAPIDVRA